MVAERAALDAATAAFFLGCIVSKRSNDRSQNECLVISDLRRDCGSCMSLVFAVVGAQARVPVPLKAALSSPVELSRILALELVC